MSTSPCNTCGACCAVLPQVVYPGVDTDECIATVDGRYFLAVLLTDTEARRLSPYWWNYLHISSEPTRGGWHMYGAAGCPAWSGIVGRGSTCRLQDVKPRVCQDFRVGGYVCNWWRVHAGLPKLPGPADEYLVENHCGLEPPPEHSKV